MKALVNMQQVAALHSNLPDAHINNFFTFMNVLSLTLFFSTLFLESHALIQKRQ